MSGDTLDATHEADSDASGDRANPGIVLVFSGSAPLLIPIPMGGGTLTIGRGMTGAALPDERVSRSHAELTHTIAGWTIHDLDSRNGTFVDGERVRGTQKVSQPRVFRFGDTLAVPCADVGQVGALSGPNGTIVGGLLRQAFAAIERAAGSSPTALVRGESGTGKELAARLYHQRGPFAAGPFIAVNCAAIPEGLAERLLFGTKRGAYSGASADAVGHVQAADHGVLFLDEGGELDLGVQAKLLRMLETREVVPLGASRGEPVDLRVCVATHRDLRAAVAGGRFRADLYHRIAPPEIVLPPLRERTDEIAEHVAAEVAKVSARLTAHAKLVEACLLRAWPGNVRELQKQIRDAAVHAEAEGSDRVRLQHLPQIAGQPFGPDPEKPEAEAEPALGGEADGQGRRPYVRWNESLTKEKLEKALEEHGGNVANAARALGMQRTQMYRELARWSLPRPPRS